jgi:hypothetical protein
MNVIPLLELMVYHQVGIQNLQIIDWLIMFLAIRVITFSMWHSPIPIHSDHRNPIHCDRG